MYEKVGNILKMAKQSNNAAIGFICMDYVMARTVVYAAEATNTPAIIMLFPEHVTIQGTTGFAGYAAMVKELAEQVKVPIGLHCDHDYSYDAIMNTIAGGFGSVMMDGSMHDLDTNIRLTKEVVDKAHELGVFVEGEIGHVGAAAASDNDKEDLYTKPDAAAKFCRETGVDSLAVTVGNAHGDYKETPHLDMKRLDEIHAATDVSLVLHGGSGIPDDQLLVAFAEENAKNPDPVKVINMPAYVQAKLQPYVAWLTDGCYRYQGQLYHMPIHGFAPTAEFAVGEQRESSVTLVLESTPELYRQYPFRFCYRICYRLEGSALRAEITVENLDEKTMYFGLGGHPGINVPLEPGLSFTDYVLEFPPCQPRRVEFTPACFITGQEVPYPLRDGKLPLRHDMFDEDAIVLKGIPGQVTLKSPAGNRGVTLKAPDFPVFGFWHAPGTEAPYICLEPWSSLPSRQDVIEDLEQQPDLIALPAGKTYRTTWSLEFF